MFAIPHMGALAAAARSTQAQLDPYWSNVVLQMHFDGTFADRCGHAVNEFSGAAYLYVVN